ncbi:hypothetical protein AB832_04610 [Flavobacteriaceae bacterium (ex Bugula neritina AB1)]|jgi:hypothetical protein|nr:hypothetical protein AB832_04610 [Flavobacteriaceae bacterium (ex Bugula neritina AB1)]
MNNEDQRKLFKGGIYKTFTSKEDIKRFLDDSTKVKMFMSSFFESMSEDQKHTLYSQCAIDFIKTLFLFKDDIFYTTINYDFSVGDTIIQEFEYQKEVNLTHLRETLLGKNGELKQVSVIQL